MKTYPNDFKKDFDADYIRLEYLRETDKKKKDGLFMILAGIWIGYVYARLKQFKPHERDDVIQLYYMFVLDHINNYTGKNGATFKSYLHFAAKSALSAQRNYEKKMHREHKIDPELLDDMNDVELDLICGGDLDGHITKKFTK